MAAGFPDDWFQNQRSRLSWFVQACIKLAACVFLLSQPRFGSLRYFYGRRFEVWQHVSKVVLVLFFCLYESGISFAGKLDAVLRCHFIRRMLLVISVAKQPYAAMLRPRPWETF